MQWKDIFYFSHSERRALTLLLFLLTGGWLLLHFSDSNQQYNSDNHKSADIRKDTIRGSNLPLISKNKSPKESINPPAIKKQTSSAHPRQEKFTSGTVVELNSADTTLLKKVPGIGSTFAKRIIKYRDLLGGFYTVNQLSEVYGIDEERFHNLKNWFCTDTTHIIKSDLNKASETELKKHPYITSPQAKTIIRIRKQKGKITWENLLLLEEFTEFDRERLKWYYPPTP